MFEMTLGNWVPVTRLLTDSVSQWYLPVFLGYKLIVGFAVLKVVTGVFINETFNTAKNDDELMVMQRTALSKLYKKKMKQLFEEVDKSGDGRISWSEFKGILDDDRLKTWLSAMELDVSDTKLLFDLIDNGDGAISSDELVLGVKKLKGAARSLDMVTVMREIKELSRELQRLQLRGTQPVSGEHFREILRLAIGSVSSGIADTLMETLAEFEASRGRRYDRHERTGATHHPNDVQPGVVDGPHSHRSQESNPSVITPTESAVFKSHVQDGVTGPSARAPAVVADAFPLDPPSAVDLIQTHVASQGPPATSLTPSRSKGPADVAAKVSRREFDSAPFAVVPCDGAGLMYSSAPGLHPKGPMQLAQQHRHASLDTDGRSISQTR